MVSSTSVCSALVEMWCVASLIVFWTGQGIAGAVETVKGIGLVLVRGCGDYTVSSRSRHSRADQ